jgi:sugar-specific transcriptional regulator TrmB
MISELLRLGLTDEEARIYVACLEINGGPVSVIARKANVHRVSAYHTLENLLEKKLLSEYNRNGVKCFAPEAPEKLEQLALERVNLAKMLLPQLKSLTSAKGFRPRIRFYEGMDGVERVFNESLSGHEETRTKESSMQKNEILGYTNLKQIAERIPAFFTQYTHRRMKSGIKVRYLSPNTVESVHAIDPFLPEKYDPNLIEILLVNKDQFPFDNEILLFGNQVGIVSLNPDELLGIIVESATLARTMKAIFDLAWLGATTFVAK